ncbi:MAG: AMIN domain-containing protein [Terriglobales bacterium]
MIARLPAATSFILIRLCLATSLALQAQAPQPAVIVSAPATASIERVDVSPRPDGLTIKIAVNAAVIPEAGRLSNPERLVFDFPGCDMKGGNRHIPVNHGPVKELRLSLFSIHPPVARVVVQLKSPLDFKLKPAENGIVVVDIPFPKTQTSLPADVHSSETHTPIPERSPVTPAPPPQKQSGPEIPGRTASEPGAYSLMAKAKALTVEDLQALEEKAAASDPDAQTMLALAYHAGVLLKRDDAEAVRLLHRAADRESMAAEEALGIFSEAGIGMERPAPADAMNWYEKAAQQGSPDAATNIALMYANGKGVRRDTTQAVSWFRRAAEGGDASAQYNLALMYERGEGVPQDYKDAARWLSLAADQNLVPAILDLAELSLQPPTTTMTIDVAKAVQYYEKAANLGSATAQATLGTIFTKGLPGKVDYEQAVKWYRRAAEQGEPDGELGLGVSYALGHGVPVDFEEARRLLTEAAVNGQIEAQYDLAIMCEEGKGGSPDQDLASHYYEMAADRGMAKAQYRYGLLLAKSSESRTNRIAAYKWLMLAQGSIKDSSPALSDLRKSMNEQETSEAEREVDNWRLAHRATGR